MLKHTSRTAFCYHHFVNHGFDCHQLSGFSSIIVKVRCVSWGHFLSKKEINNAGRRVSKRGIFGDEFLGISEEVS